VPSSFADDGTAAASRLAALRPEATIPWASERSGSLNGSASR